MKKVFDDYRHAVEGISLAHVLCLEKLDSENMWMYLSAEYQKKDAARKILSAPKKKDL